METTLDRGTDRSMGDGKPETTSPRRLVVDLGRHVARLLADLVRTEGANKTTIVNRAIQVYALVREVQDEGGKIYIQREGSKNLERWTLL